MSTIALRFTALAAAALALAACKGTDPLYCDFENPCDDGPRDFCDLDGVFPGSEGVGNTCIVRPAADACNRAEVCETAARPHCNTAGQCVECTVSGHCPDAEPHCSADQVCVPCTAADDGDAACLSAYPARPLCAADGACVGCIGAEDCAGETPICDPEPRACRACASHDECTTLVCEPSGACLEELRVVYVDPTGTDGPMCGTLAAPCRSIGAALALTGGNRTTVRLAPGVYPERIALSAGRVRILGAGGAIVRPPAGAEPAVSVSGAASLTLDEVEVDGQASGGPGLSCAGTDTETAALTQLGGAVRGFPGVGVSTADCLLSLRGVSVLQNAGGGVVTQRSDVAIVNSIIAVNGSTTSARGGVWLGETLGRRTAFAFNTVVGNRVAAGAQAGSALSCSQGGVEIDSSIVRLGSGGGGFGLHAGDCRFRFSSVEGGAGGPGNVDLDPGFVAPAAGDYHLAADSPLEGAGNPLATFHTDIDGDPRPAGDGYDIGADEIAEEIAE